MTDKQKQRYKEYQKVCQKEYGKTMTDNKNKDIKKLEINVVKINIIT